MYSENSLQETIDRYLNGSASEEERILVEKWFEATESNSQDMPVSEEAKEKLFARIAAMIQNEKPEGSVVQMNFNENEKQNPFWNKWRIAASILVIVCSAIGYYVFHGKVIKGDKEDSQLLSVNTKMGEVKEVILPDSSHVWLNANARLSYKSNFLENRELKLEGEALFEVTHDSLHPFSVTTPDGSRVKVLGTRFDLRYYANDSSVNLSVVRGHVSFANKEKVLDTLSKGDIGNYNRYKNEYKKSNNVDDISKVEGWITGKWQFDNMTINELARLLYDQYGVQLIVQKESLKRSVVSANFTKEQSSEDIIKVFCTLVQCKYKWGGKSVIMLY